VPVAEFPEGLVQYLGTPVKLLVIEDYEGFGRRYFFSTDLDDGAQEILTTWEQHREVVGELKSGLERSPFLTRLRNEGFVMKALSLLVPPAFKYSTGLNLGAKRLSRLVRGIYQEAGSIKQLFKRRRNP